LAGPRRGAQSVGKGGRFNGLDRWSPIGCIASSDRWIEISAVISILTCRCVILLTTYVTYPITHWAQYPVYLLEFRNQLLTHTLEQPTSLTDRRAVTWQARLDRSLPLGWYVLGRLNTRARTEAVLAMYSPISPRGMKWFSAYATRNRSETFLTLSPTRCAVCGQARCPRLMTH
jgi:hypothetical protein